MFDNLVMKALVSPGIAFHVGLEGKKGMGLVPTDFFKKF